MLHSGTCGIYERDTTDKDDGLGVVIIRFTEITPDGKKYVLANDPNSYIVLSDCTDPSACSGTSSPTIHFIDNNNSMNRCSHNSCEYCRSVRCSVGVYFVELCSCNIVIQAISYKYKHNINRMCDGGYICGFHGKAVH
jgi:hypothetical protein